MKELLFYLEGSLWTNPDWSKQKNWIARIINFLIVLIGALYLFWLIQQRGFGHGLSNGIVLLVQLLYWSAMLLIQWRFGRKYVKGTEKNLILKTQYLKPAVTIDWHAIEEITFDGDNFELDYQNGELKKLRFKAPLEKYLDLRTYFKEMANSHSFRIVE